MTAPDAPAPRAAPSAGVAPLDYPDNPVLCRIRRGGLVESQHRGAWVLVDGSGTALDGVGSWDHPIYARSSIKSIQALPLLESGAAERFGVSDVELALALASHNGEPIHTGPVLAFLERLGLSPESLACGAHRPFDSRVAWEMRSRGEVPTALHNNCSGKHAGFLALTLHLGADPASYLDPDGPAQRMVRDALAGMAGVDADRMDVAVDGCSAPNYRLPLRALATAIARLSSPGALEPGRRTACERIVRAAGVHPELIGGTRKRLDTDLLRVAGGRLFPKLGAEAVYVVGVVGADRALAIKVDDGHYRGFHALVVDLLARLGFLDDAQAEQLGEWRETPVKNWAGLEVGTVEVVA